MSTTQTKLDIIAAESEKAFAAENERRDKLSERAEKITAAVGLIAGFQLIDLKSLAYPGAWPAAVPFALTVISLLSLAAALLLALLGMRVHDYVSYPRGYDLRDGLTPAAVDDAQARAKVTNTYFEMREHNAKINDKRARLVGAGATLLVAGFLLAVAGQVASRLIR